MSISATHFDFVCKLVKDRAAIILSKDKEYLVESRLLPVARGSGFGSLDELVASISKQSFNGLHQQVVEALTTNETSFFRDNHPFQALRQAILPDIIKKRAATKTINMWCGASSTGQEPYTVAMTIAEHFPELTSWRINFLATDISTEVLEQARKGEYSRLEVNRGLPAPLLVKYFGPKGLHWVVKEPLKKMVRFQQMNLAGTWLQMSPMDIVFMRNVLIYFDTSTKKQIFAKLRNVLQPDGYLFLGGAETTLNIDNNFERVQLDRVGVYRLKQ